MKVLQTTDVRAIAELCESIGLDFQIILLTRSPENILISTTVHRNFGPNFGHQAELYHYVQRIVLSQLGNMDPRFLTGVFNKFLDFVDTLDFACFFTAKRLIRQFS